MSHFTYLAIILVPGLPAMALTLFIGRRSIARNKKSALGSIAVLTLYSALADWVAIRLFHIWSFREELVTGPRFLDLYIEEWVLFLIAQSLLVCWTLVLMDRVDIGKER